MNAADGAAEVLVAPFACGFELNEPLALTSTSSAMAARLAVADKVSWRLMGGLDL